MKNDTPIIIALDYDNLDRAKAMLNKVRPYVSMAKIGLELFTAVGHRAFELSQEFDIPLFVDLKLHDTPLTVSKTISVLSAQLPPVAPYPGKHFVSIHTLGGGEMCNAAFLSTRHSDIELVGITVLTSLDSIDLSYLGFAHMIEEQTINLTLSGISSALTHFVCAPTQIKLLRAKFGDGVTLITPGIREERGDATHKQFTSAAQAIKNGADWIVIGKPITKAVDPVQAAIYFKDQVDKC